MLPFPNMSELHGEWNHIQRKTTAKNAAADHPQSRLEGKRCLPEAEGPHTQCTVKWNLVAETPGEE